MEITLINQENVFRPGDRGLTSYCIGTIQVNANNLDEIREMIQAMQRWSDGTFEDVQVSRTEEGPIIVGNKRDQEELESKQHSQQQIEDGNINLLTGDIF